MTCRLNKFLKDILRGKHWLLSACIKKHLFNTYCFKSIVKRNSEELAALYQAKSDRDRKIHITIKYKIQQNQKPI